MMGAVHVVAVLALDGVVAFDLSTPVEVFGRAELRDGAPAYEVRVCSGAGEVDAGAFRLRTPWGLDALATADTIVVPGVADPQREVPGEVLAALRAAAARGARVASICVGAFTLAATGLLDGRRATTHWAAAAELARRHPAIDVDPAVLFVDEGQVLTSAGAAAGLDLCLHLVRRDHVVLLGGDQLLMAASAPATVALFAGLGYRPSQVDISEFERLEGCVTCLSVRLRKPPR